MDQDKPSYLNWLVNLKDVGLSEYFGVCKILHSIPFKYTIYLDEDREADGMELRESYYAEFGDYPIVPFPNQASFLEVLIGMVHMFENWSDLNPDQSTKLMHTFFINLNIQDLSGKRLTSEEERYVKSRVNIMMNHEYSADGSNGGLYIVPNTNKDFTRCNLYHQMVEYDKYAY